MGKTESATLPAIALPAGAPVHTLGPQQVPPEARPITSVIVGNTGSGKSSVGRAAFVEPILHNKRRCCIVDPTGVWWGLRFAANGGEGFPIAIVGGLYGDATLEAYDGEKLARWIGEHDQSIIVDVSEMTIGERHEFGEDFFASLYRHNRRPLHLVIDEADEFAPQNPMPETKRLLHHVDRIVRRGRVRGFRPMMITQRPSVLHKNVMSQASALVAMRLLGSQDRDAVQLWIKGQGDLAAGKEVLNTLARLQQGEGWLWVPGMGILNRGTFRLFTTFDSSRTPKDDENAVEPPGPFPFADRFDDLVEYMQADRDEPGDESESTGVKITRAAAPDELVRAETLGYERGHREGLAKGYDVATSTLQGKLTGVLNAGEAFLLELREVGRQLGTDMVVMPTKESVDDWAARNVTTMTRAKPIDNVITLESARGATRIRTEVSHNGAADKLLQACARYSHQPLKWAEICIAAGMAYENGYFYGGRKYLLAEALVTEGSGQVLITPAGVRVAGGEQKALTRKELIAIWTDKLKAPGGQMLAAIAAAKGLQLTKAQLASACGIKPDNGHWYGGVKAVRKASLVEIEGEVYRLSAFVRAAK